MRVRLLGTGSADGWPNPFCCCASCVAAADSPRAQTSVLIDDTLLIDLAPDTPRAAVRHGINLASVRGILLSHQHFDHTAPAALRYRDWAARTPGELLVAGDATAVNDASRWSRGPSFLPIQPGETVDVAGYLVHAHAVEHEVLCLAFEITAPDGARLLYASDTGPLAPSTLRALSGRRVDVLLLEETFGPKTDHGTKHLDFLTFPTQLAQLRDHGVINDQTRIVAVHLSHHNPPPAELREIFATWGVELLDDGSELGPADRWTSVDRPHRKRTLVLGGVRSGKSTWAERELAAQSGVTYVATASAHDDDDWQSRVAAHRARRPTRWQTVETLDLPKVLEDSATVLIDDLGNWLARTLDETDGWNGELIRYRNRATALIEAWRTFPGRGVMVSNEVGSGVHPTSRSGRLFRDELGRLNAALAEVSDEVVLVTAGIPQWLRKPFGGSQ